MSSIATSSRVTLFEDIFEIHTLNPEGKKFERVNRLSATGSTFECDLLLDYNCQIYNTLYEGSKITVVFASTLNLDGSPDDHMSYNPANNIQNTSSSTSSSSSAALMTSSSSLSTSTAMKKKNATNNNVHERRMMITLADSYEYVMHGRVFDISYKQGGIIVIAISFGGLLCRLTGDQRHLSSILPDMRLYLLVKKD